MEVRGLGRARPLTRSGVTKIASVILREHGVESADCSVVFVSDSSIKGLNLRFLGRGRPTDVIAFGLDGGPLRREAGRGRRVRRLTGDIAISADRARCQARRFGTSFKHEISLYLVHGLLHLLGYDDGPPGKRGAMRRMEKEYMERLCGLRTS